MIIAFGGHSDYIENENDEKKILEILENKVGSSPCELFLGEYGGFDRFAYRCAKTFKANHPNAKLVFITPYLSVKNKEDNMECKKDRFDLVIYPDLEQVPPRYAITHRNRWIVEQADMIIVYIDHEFGGAYTMYRHAMRKNKAVYNIAVERNGLETNRKTKNPSCF